MMTRIKLYSWSDSTATDIDISWPKVHRTLGIDQTNWLLNQSWDNCQLVVDKINEKFTLVAEFYNEQTLAIYYLMWAK